MAASMNFVLYPYIFANVILFCFCGNTGGVGDGGCGGGGFYFVSYFLGKYIGLKLSSHWVNV